MAILIYVLAVIQIFLMWHLRLSLWLALAHFTLIFVTRFSTPLWLWCIWTRETLRIFWIVQSSLCWVLNWCYKLPLMRTSHNSMKIFYLKMCYWMTHFSCRSWWVHFFIVLLLRCGSNLLFFLAATDLIISIKVGLNNAWGFSAFWYRSKYSQANSHLL